MKVKNGAENMIQSITSGHHGRDKKLLAEAQQMLADSKTKIEFLKLRILKVRQNRNYNKVYARWQLQIWNYHGVFANILLVCFCSVIQIADENGDGKKELETSLEDRVEELLHRFRIEAAVVAGAKNVIKILQNTKVPDKKALQEVWMFSVYNFLVIHWISV